MNTISKLSAFGGTGHKTRKNDSLEFFTNEYSYLKSVVLYTPGIEVHQIKKPNSVQHLDKINYVALKKEINAIKKFYKKNRIDVVEILPIKNIIPPPNLFFARDLFWMGPKGMIISRMGSSIRSLEEKFILNSANLQNIPIHSKIPSPALLEGADVLWLTPNELLIGINNRTNIAAIVELKKLFPELKIHPIKLPKSVQHLLGMIQIIDQKKALIRYEIAPKKLIDLLYKKKFTLVKIPETDEVTKRQGMNIVTIKPNQIIMPDDCPELENIYRKNKIKILSKLRITELRKAAGGLACLTGILKRIN